MKEDKLDWFAAVTLNPDKDYANFSIAGYDSRNTIMKSPEEYKKNSFVQKLFTDESGNFNNQAFDQRYNEALKTYNTFISGDIQDKYFREYTGTIYNPNAKKIVNPSLKVTMVDNPFNTSYGLVGFNKESKPVESVREIAQRSNVVDSSTNKALDFKPNDFLKSIFGEPLVEARWESDGTHIDSWGNEVNHNKGDWKLKEGKPYYETLGNRDTTGKNFLHWTDVITDDGSFMNSIDFLDSDSLEKSITGQTVKTIVTVGSLFVPVLNSALIGFGVVNGLSDISSTLIKSIEEATTDENAPKSKLWEYANQMDGFFRRFDRSVSDEASEKTWGYENMTNIVDEIFQQLKQQKWIAKKISEVPKWFGESELKAVDKFIAKNKNLNIDKYGKTLENAIKDGDITKDFKSMKEMFGTLKEFQTLENATIKATKLGQELGSNYMALLQSKDVYENLKESGFDSETVLLGTVAASLGFIGIMKTDLGKVAYRAFGPNEVQKSLSPIIKDAIKETAEASGFNVAKTGAGKMKFIKKAYDAVLNKTQDLWNAKGEYGVKGYISDMLKEGIEETSEELIQDAVMQGSKYYEEGLRSAYGFKSKNTYNWNETDPFNRYMMSFFGGVLGGGIFKASDHIENFKTIREAKAAKDLSDDTMTRLVSTLVNFDLAKVENEINKELDKGIISDKLSSEITEDSKADNINYKPATNSNLSQREIVRTNLIEFVRGVDAYLNRSNLKWSEMDVANAALGKAFVGKQISNQFTKLIYTDYLTAAAAKTKLELQIAGLEDGEEKTNLKKELLEKNKAVEDILSGARAGEYAEKIAFVNNPVILNAFMSPTVELYTKSQFGKDYILLNEEEKAKADKSYEKYVSEAETNLDVVKAYKMFKIFKEKFQDPEVDKFVNNSELFKNYSTIQSILRPEEYDYSEEDLMGYVNDIKEGRTNDEIIDQFNLNKIGKKLSEEEKEKLVNDALLNLVESNPTMFNFGKNIKNYNFLLGSNYLLNPTSSKPENVIEKIRETISEGGKIDHYTRQMLQSYLDSINDDLDTDKTFKKSILSLIKDFNKEDLSNSKYERTYSLKDEEDKDIIDKLLDAFVSIDEEFVNTMVENNINLFQLLNNEKYLNLFIHAIKQSIENEKLSIDKDILSEWNALISLKKDLEDITNIDNIYKDPIYDILSHFSKELYGRDLFELLKNEDDDFKKTSIIDNYVIRNIIDQEELTNMLNIINITRSVIFSLSSDADYVNTINTYNIKQGKKPYAELDSEKAIVFDKALSNIVAQISFLLNLSNLNSESKITTDKRTWLSTQLYLFDRLKEFVSEHHVNIDLEEIDKLRNNSDNLSFEEILANSNSVMKELEKELYEFFDIFPNKKEILFKGDNPLLKLKKDYTLNDKITLEKIKPELGYSDLLFKLWLLSTVTTNPEEFNDNYQDFLQNSKMKAPFYSQMLNVKIINAFINDKENFFNEFGNLNDKKYAENLIYINASSGAGKSTMIAPFVWNILKSRGEKSWVVSNNENNLNTVLENITNINEEEVKTKSNFFKEILGGIDSDNYKTYTEILENEENKENKKTDENDSKTKDLIDKLSIPNDLPKFVLYDEAGHLSYFERDIIEKLGIKLIAMGDLTQDSYINKKGLIRDIDYGKQLLKTPQLPSGIRFDNLNKRLSTLILLEIANELNSIFESKEVSTVKSKKLAQIKSIITTKEFKYYQTEKEILGDKVVELKDLISNNKLTSEYEDLIRNLIKDKKSVVYISDENNKNLEFESYLKNDLQVNIVDSDSIQGKQYDYTIINVKFNNIFESEDSDVVTRTFKKFNTLLTRSKNGSIVISDNNHLPISISRKVFREPIDVSINDQEIADYKEYWLNSYFNNDNVEKKEIINKSKKVDEMIIEDFDESSKKIKSHSDNRYKEILRTYIGIVNKNGGNQNGGLYEEDDVFNDKTIRDSLFEDYDKIKNSNEIIGKVLNDYGGYLKIDDIFKELNPYDENNNINKDYWLLNLIFFNKPDQWQDLLKKTTTDGKKLSDYVNANQLENCTLSFSDNGNVTLNYLDNNNQVQNILLQNFKIKFPEFTAKFTSFAVETNNVNFRKDENRKVIKTSKKLSKEDLEKDVNKKVKISNTLHAGKINDNVGIYAFATYNLWYSNPDTLATTYNKNKNKNANNQENASPIMVNPIGRSFNDFASQWKNSNSMITYDRLLGFNQSYRLIKALIDYKNNNNLSKEDKKSYNDELNNFLNDITTTININTEKNLKDINGNGVLDNLFNFETKISKKAKEYTLFKSITNYIVNKNINEYSEIKEIFDDVKGALDHKTNLTRYKDKYNLDDVKNISDELNKIAKSKKYREINEICKEILEGIDLMTSNEQNLSEYFKTDLYFSLTYHIRVTKTIVQNLTDTSKKYNLLLNTIENLTNNEKNNNSGLFKDGIWDNYVALKDEGSISAAKKVNNLYPSWKNVKTVYFDNYIEEPSVFIKLDKNFVTLEPKVKTKNSTSSKNNLPNLNEMTTLDELFDLSDEQLIQYESNSFDINNAIVNEFLTFKIIQNGEKWLSLQLDNDDKYILKDVTEKLNQLENKQIINGFVYQNSIPLAYIEGEGFVKLENVKFTTEIISKLAEQDDDLDETDKELIQKCIDLEIIEESNVENIKEFLISNSLYDLKVLRNIIDNLPKQYGDILINNDIWDKYEIKLLDEEKEAIASILKQDKYTLCK